MFPNGVSSPRAGSTLAMVLTYLPQVIEKLNLF